MIPQDAAKILEIDGDLTPEIVKKAYKKMSLKFHPDRNGSIEMMQAVNDAYETLKDFNGNVEAGASGYSDAFNDALNKVIDLPDIEIEICGSWIWVTGDTWQHREILGKDGAGFNWNRKKKAWSFRPSDWKSLSRGNWSLDRIRNEHGSEKVQGKSQVRLAS